MCGCGRWCDRWLCKAYLTARRLYRDSVSEEGGTIPVQRMIHLEFRVLHFVEVLLGILDDI